MLKQEMSLPPRKDSFTGIFGNFNDDLLASFGLSHTPPTLSTSMDAPMKRNRTGSISGRLRSASDLEDKGFIDRYQKGILKVRPPYLGYACNRSYSNNVSLHAPVSRTLL